MNTKLLEFSVVGIVVAFLVIAGFAIINPQTTGMMIEERSVTAVPEEYAYALKFRDVVNRFFGILDVEFPQGYCTKIAEELYNEVALHSLDVTSGYETKGSSKTATKNFVIESKDYFGTLDMIKGADLFDEAGTDSLINVDVCSVVRTPKKQRVNFYKMHLYGKSEGFLVVKKGEFSTPSLDCTFTSNKGIAECSCKTHPIENVITD